MFVLLKISELDQIAFDSNCSSFIMSRLLCQPKVHKSTAILTAGRKCLHNYLVYGLMQALLLLDVIDNDDTVVENACWLLPAKDSQHINLMELYAIIKGINLAILWKKTTLYLFTDSACVHKSIREQTKATSRIVIQWRLDTIIKFAEKYALSMYVSLIRSSRNKTGRLTSEVPWCNQEEHSVCVTCLCCICELNGFDQIKIVYQ